MNQDTNHYLRIKLLNGLSNFVVDIGMKNGYGELADKVDLTCGAVPEGEFSDVIDPAAAGQFLKLYTEIAEFRFAVAVTETLRINQALLDVMKKMCFMVGRNFSVDLNKDAEQGFEYLNTVLLDGNPGEELKEVSVSSKDEVEWTEKYDSHEPFWKKAGGDVFVYYQLQKSFIDGLLENSGLVFENKGARSFSIKVKS